MKLTSNMMDCQTEIFISSVINDSRMCRRSESVSKRYSNTLHIEQEPVVRRHSMPSPFRLSLSSNDIRRDDDKGDIIRRVRSFKTTSKGLVNSGDFLRKRGSETIMFSGCTVTLGCQDTPVSPVRKRERAPSTTSEDSGAGHSLTSSCAPSYFRILVLGASGVGKTSLTNQFMSSENTGVNNDHSGWDQTVSVVLDDEESLLEFSNFPDDQMPEEDINVDAYVVIFSIMDKSTYVYAINVIKHLRNTLGSDRTIILVANKTDLVRNRTVTRDHARQTASHYDCKYIETSATLNHKVDELLVGIVSQIRIKLNPEKLVEHVTKMELKKLKERKGSLKAAKTILNKLFQKQKSFSCDNLYEL